MKRLDLVIATQYQDAGMRAATRDLEKMHRQLTQFSSSALSVRNITQSAFGGLGNLIQNTAGMVGKGVAGIGTAMKGLGSVFDAKGLGGVGKLFSGAGGLLTGVGSAVGGLGKILGPVVGVFGALGGVALDVFGRISSAVLSVASTIGGVLVSALEKAMTVAGAAGAAIAGVLAMTAKHGLEVRSTLQGAEVAFGTMLKSPEAATGLMKDLRREAIASAFDFQKLAGAGQQLLAFGFKAREIVGTVRALGDAALIRGSQGAGDRLDRLVGALGKVKATGALQGDEANMLQEAGLNVREMLKIPLGLDFGNLKIEADKAIGGILAGINAQFGGLQGRMAGMTDFLLSALRDSWDDFSSTITAGFQARWDSALRRVLGVFGELTSTAQGQRVTDALTRGFDLLGAAIDWAAAQIPQLISAFDGLVQAGKWDGFLNTIRNVFGEVWSFGVGVAQGIAANWGTIWPTIAGVAVASLKVIGGTISGVMNIGREWFASVATGGDIFKALGVTMKDFADAAVVGMWQVGKQALELWFIFSSITTIVGILTKNMEMVGKGVAGIVGAAAGKTRLDKGTATIRGEIAGINTDKIGRQFQALAGQQGIGGAFARGFLDFGKQVDGFLEKMGRGVTVPLIPLSPVQAPASPGGGLPAGPGGLNSIAIQQHVKELEGQAGAWGAILEASKAYGETLGDHARATRGVLTATLGNLGSLNQLHSAQKQLLAAQKPFTSEWWKSLEAVNKTAKEVVGITGAMRDLLFDVTKLNAATDFGDKLFSLAKDAGLDPKEITAIATQQQAALLQTLDVERARLGTLEKGSIEWLKQRGTIVDTISKVVNLRKELDKANGAVASQQLMGFAKTPYGVRGAGVERGPLHQDTDLARMTRDLLKWSASGPTVDLAREASRLQQGGMPLGELKGMAPATAAGVPAAVTYTGNANVAFYGNINDTATVAKIAGQKAEEVVGRALGQLFNQGQMRGGR